MMTRRTSSFSRIAIAAITPPSANDPVSPINTLAGWALNTRNPSNAPTALRANKVTVRFGVPYHAKMQKLRKLLPLYLQVNHLTHLLN